MISRKRQHILLFLLFLSGAAGLIYEVVWTRQLIVVFGTSVYAVSAVLAAFMLGLALGSYLFGRFADRWRNPLTAYGWLEVGVAGCAAVLPVLIRGAEAAYLWAHGLLASQGLILAVRFFLAVIILLPATILMGGTLPVAGKLFAAEFNRFGSSLARLYGMNTLGAVLGAFVAGFVLIQAMGNQGALRVAIVLTLVAGSTALGLGRGLRWTGSDEPTPAGETPKGVQGIRGLEYPSWARQAVLAAVAVSGFCALGYEVLWTRILVLLLGNSTWAFSTTLVTFLLSLSLGSFLIAPLLDRRFDRLILLATVQTGIAVLAALSLPAFRWVTTAQIGTAGETLAQVVLTQFGAAAAVMFPATLLLGMALPLAARIYTERPERAGQGFGATLAANTAGAVTGSAIAGFGLVPLLGLQNSVLLLALLNGGTALVLVLVARVSPRVRVATLVPAGVVGVALLIGLFPAKPPLENPPPGFEALYYEEGVAGTVSIYRQPESGLKVLNINHITEVATDRTSMVTFRLMAYLPVLLHPDPKDALVVTFGAGIVAGSLAQLDLDRIDCVEINPRAPQVGSYFAEENRRVLENPKMRLYIEDGRNYLFTTRKPYDIITADATHPTGADSWVLYTREYYDLCRRRLRPGGIFLQWLPLHALSPSDYRTIVATCASVFDNLELWFTGLEGEVGHTLLVASEEELPIDVGRISSRLANPIIAKDLQPHDLDSAEALLALVISDRRGLQKLTGGAPMNTDNRAVTAFPRELPAPDLATTNLQMILASRSFPQGIAADSSARRKVRAAWDVAGWLLQAQLALRRGELKRATGLLMQAGQVHTDVPLLSHLQEAVRDDLVAVYLSRGDQWFQQRKPDEARRAYRQAAALAGRRATPYLRLASLHAELGQPDSAYACVRQAATLEPTAEVYFNLGLIADQLGRQDEAISAYRKALEKEPQLGIAYTNLGRLYAQRGDWDKARWAWEQALAVNPEDQLARRNLQRLEEVVK